MSAISAKKEPPLKNRKKNGEDIAVDSQEVTVVAEEAGASVETDRDGAREEPSSSESLKVSSLENLEKLSSLRLKYRIRPSGPGREVVRLVLPTETQRLPTSIHLW